MLRTSSSGMVFSTLATLLVGCGDEKVCEIDVCNGGCVDTNTDPQNCGVCNNQCNTDQSCSAGECVACAAPSGLCGDVCVDLTSSVDHCGDCDTMCAADADCITGQCASPLVAMRTANDNANLELDSFTVRDVSFAPALLANIPLIAGSRVIDQAVLPDGNLLLVAAEETSGVFELWLASPRGDSLVKLSPTLVTGGDVLPGLAVSADGSKVLYRADEDVDGEIDLYAVSIANPGTSVKVNGALATGGQVSRVFALSEDGTRATYIADQDSAGLDELYTVDLSAATPGPSEKLADGLDFPSMWDFQMSADGSRVLFRTDLNQNRPQLFVVDIATPTTVTPVDNSDFKGLFHVNDDYRMSADGSVVIYSGSDSFNSESMWMAPLAGPTIDSTLLADTPDGFNTTVRETLAVSPDGKRVFFRQDVSQGFTGLFVVELATPEVVTPVYDAETLEIDADNLALSPDGNHLVFGANGDGGEGGFQNPGTSGNGSSSISTELYAIDLTQTLPATPVRIATDDVKSDGIESDYIPLDDGRVILRGDLDTPGAAEVYIGSPAAPDTVTKISPPLGLVNATRVAAMNRFR